ncbi:MAG: ATP/GTP-binding protein [Acidimicrobiia bacterium]|nr:ATP/GTP-binding protein [Acidimicrobiia bacterium]
MSTNATPGAMPPRALKVVIAGGFGVGKTTIVGTLSEVKPLRTEAKMTAASIGIDDTSKINQKTTTTVAMDFGRITIDRSLIMYLFGTPGQDRFGFMWDDLVTGVIGAVVLVDLRRVDDCFDAVDYFEHRSIPFVVAVNVFDPNVTYPEEVVRDALSVSAHVPIVSIDARDRESAKAALLTLLGVLVNRKQTAGALA